MKKLLLIAAAVFAFSAPAFAQDGRGRDNGRDHRSYQRDGGHDSRGWQRDRGNDRWNHRRSYASRYRYRSPPYYGAPYGYGYSYGNPYYDGYGYPGTSLGFYFN